MKLGLEVGSDRIVVVVGSRVGSKVMGSAVGSEVVGWTEGLLVGSEVAGVLVGTAVGSEWVGSEVVGSDVVGSDVVVVVAAIVRDVVPVLVCVVVGVVESQRSNPDGQSELSSLNGMHRWSSVF